MTKYRVFIKNEGELPVDATWSEVGTFDGHTPKAAVSAAIVASDEPDVATFAAIPHNSFHVLTPDKVETTTVVSFA